MQNCCFLRYLVMMCRPITYTLLRRSGRFLSVPSASLVSSVSSWGSAKLTSRLRGLRDEGLLMTVSSRTLRITWQGYVVPCINACLTVPLHFLCTRSLLRNRQFLQETRSKTPLTGSTAVYEPTLQISVPDNRECCSSETAAHVSRKSTTSTGLSEALACPQVSSHAELCVDNKGFGFLKLLRASPERLPDHRSCTGPVLAVSLTIVASILPGGRHDDMNGTVIRLAVRAFLGGPFVVHDAH